MKKTFGKHFMCVALTSLHLSLPPSTRLIGLFMIFMAILMSDNSLDGEKM